MRLMVKPAYSKAAAVAFVSYALSLKPEVNMIQKVLGCRRHVVVNCAATMLQMADGAERLLGQKNADQPCTTDVNLLQRLSLHQYLHLILPANQTHWDAC
jgi:hypothetical protein